jgi:hypothetical protein
MYTYHSSRPLGLELTSTYFMRALLKKSVKPFHIPEISCSRSKKFKNC